MSALDVLYAQLMHDLFAIAKFLFCVCYDCCSPLHVAVVQADLSLVQQILQTLIELSLPVDCYNNLRQVIIVVLTFPHPFSAVMGSLC